MQQQQQYAPMPTMMSAQQEPQPLGTASATPYPYASAPALQQGYPQQYVPQQGAYSPQGTYPPQQDYYMTQQQGYPPQGHTLSHNICLNHSPCQW